MDARELKGISGAVVPGSTVCKAQRGSLFAIYTHTDEAGRLALYQDRRGSLALLGAVILDDPNAAEEPVELTVSGRRRYGWHGWVPGRRLASARIHFRTDPNFGAVWALEVWPGHPGALRVPQPDGTVLVLPEPV